MTLSVTILSLCVIPSHHGFVFQNINAIQNTLQLREHVSASVISSPISATQNKENIIILQLESVNSVVAMGNFTSENINYEDVYIPQLEQISKRGIFFPYFWGNSIQTNRAQETILCGIVNNVQKSYSFNPDFIPTKCLPERLKQSGYHTKFFLGYEGLKFNNNDEFLPAIGFEDIQAESIMKPDDQQFGWGFDDCTFYERTFEYLEEHQPQKTNLFAYLEVSSHHAPFADKDGHNHAKRFPHPQNNAERYINSLLVQDHCLKTFIEEFDRYDKGNTHLFILSDHSFPVGTHENTSNEKNAYNENFLIPLVYIPPKDSAHKYSQGKIVKDIYSQHDIIPTIFSLLNKKDYPNSFAFELSKNFTKTNYESCHVLTQPYNGGQTAIVQKQHKYIYSHNNETVEYYNIEDDFLEKNPEIIHKNMSFDDFKKEYFCERL